MDLSIIIVNYHGESYLKQTLDSVFDSDTSIAFEVIVVDNGSQDRSVDIIQSYPKPIITIINSENKGFSVGNNQGLSLAKGTYVFLLNNDTILKKDTLSLCVTFLDSHSEIGALGPKLLNKDGTIQRTGSLLGSWRYKTDVPTAVSFLSGAALFMNRSFLDSLGGLDETFFFYNEDLDLCKRILAKKRSLIYFPQASLVHLGGASTKTRKPGSVFEGYRGGIYLCKKHYPYFIYLLYRVALLFVLIPSLFFSLAVSSFRDEGMAYVNLYLRLLFLKS